jgi:hypothetical protein
MSGASYMTFRGRCVTFGCRDSLQAQWCQDDDVDTERLRVVFQDYRAFLFGPSST